MRYIWSVLCKRSIIEAQTTKLSVIDVTEVLQVMHLPPPDPGSQKYALGLNLFFVTDFWLAEKDEPTVEVRLRWRMPSGEIMDLGGGQSFDATGKPQNQRIRLILEIPLVEYTGLGIYELELEMKVGKKWHKIASHPIKVALASADPIVLERPSEQIVVSPPASS